MEGAMIACGAIVLDVYGVCSGGVDLFHGVVDSDDVGAVIA
jgi:hypothetical protein